MGKGFFYTDKGKRWRIVMVVAVVMSGVVAAIISAVVAAMGFFYTDKGKRWRIVMVVAVVMSGVVAAIISAVVAAMVRRVIMRLAVVMGGLVAVGKVVVVVAAMVAGVVAVMVVGAMGATNAPEEKSKGKQDDCRIGIQTVTDYCRAFSEPIFYMNKTSIVPNFFFFSNLGLVRGLKNLGNTCYLNATLQMLARDSVIDKLIESCCNQQKTEKETRATTSSDDEVTILPSIALNCDVQNVAETMRELRDVGANTCPVRPESVLEFLRKHSGMFAAGMQHDSQECFAVLQEHLFAQKKNRKQTG
ncbi:predicted protein [Nematostella vectensis]|uniref:ubiquitinyl hydrolase 1 n=1 Tax=Nematostella vectensis TaxID=45351 RepID=A7SVC8_NEMVE|nr:predicted protein [Nematostella vectensis]|eukprot:XP_001624450.1 predicted protein [Nematostella vectensis]